MNQKLIRLTVIIAFLIGVAGSLQAADVILAWDPKRDSGLAGYKVYYGTSSRTYSLNVNVGANTTYQVTGLIQDLPTTSLSGLYAGGQETSYSNEVSKTISSTGPGVTVDGSYSGYSPAVIDDGVINAAGGTQSTWASTTTTSPHWINISLPSSSQLNFVTVWWAYNNAQAKYMTSQRVDVQYWDGTGYQTAASIQPPASNVASSTISFPTVSTTQLRLYQPERWEHQPTLGLCGSQKSTTG